MPSGDLSRDRPPGFLKQFPHGGSPRIIQAMDDRDLPSGNRGNTTMV